MVATLEKSLDIMSVEAAIEKFREAFPGSFVEKLQIEYEGPFIKYEFVGYDDQHRHTYEFNAHTGNELKNKSKPLKPKQQDPSFKARKALNLDNLRPLTEMNDAALAQVDLDQPFQWELDRQKERTVWKIEIANQTGDQIQEVKIDAQDGTIVQTKLK